MKTVKEIAEQLRVSRKTVLRWIRTGKLKAIKVDRTVRIREEDYSHLIGGEQDRRGDA